MRPPSGMYPQGRLVAPKFSDTLTLSQPGGGRFFPQSHRLNLYFPHDYVPDHKMKVRTGTFKEHACDVGSSIVTTILIWPHYECSVANQVCTSISKKN